MLEYCQQCSLELFGMDRKDLAGIVSESDFKAGHVPYGTCAGCGLIQVDATGSCVDSACPKHGIHKIEKTTGA